LSREDTAGAVSELSLSSLTRGSSCSAAREGDGYVCLRWVEREGPAVQTPTRQGFGTKMIVGTFGAEAGWSVDLDFNPGGLRCTMRFRPGSDNRTQQDEPRELTSDKMTGTGL
jgi:two-component sensor histidine kinase